MVYLKSYCQAHGIARPYFESVWMSKYKVHIRNFSYCP